MYGTNIFVDKGDIRYSLVDYLNKIRTGDVVFKGVLSVTGDENSKIIKLYTW